MKTKKKTTSKFQHATYDQMLKGKSHLFPKPKRLTAPAFLAVCGCGYLIFWDNFACPECQGKAEKQSRKPKRKSKAKSKGK